MKKKICLSLVLLLIVLLGMASRYFKVVGTVEGPEWDDLQEKGGSR